MARRPKPSGRRSGGRGYTVRRTNIRQPLSRFLIVCEGEKTEPLYFDAFRVPTVAIKIVPIRKDPLAIVEKAINYVRNDDGYNQVWCVFDKDDEPPERFNQALALAKKNKIRVAYSNQCFELWYLLHFNYCDTALGRADYAGRLSNELGRTYRKDDATLYSELLPRQEHAIQNAHRLLEQYHPHNPPYDDPSTTVHFLVQELNRFTQKNRFS